jgi:hypothetical protein
MARHQQSALESPHYAPTPSKRTPMPPAVIAGAFVVVLVGVIEMSRYGGSTHVAEIPEFAIPHGGTVLLNTTSGCTRQVVYGTDHPWTTLDFDRMKVRFEAQSWTVLQYSPSGPFTAMASPGGWPRITYDTGLLGANLLKAHHSASHEGPLVAVTTETCGPQV